MTETQREKVPRVAGGELEVALSFLRFARGCVLKKLDGLDDAAVRRRDLVVSGNNLLGIVQHLTASERYWFGHHVGGEELEIPDDDEFFSMRVAPERSVAEVVAAYRAAAVRSDAIVTAAGDLGRPAPVPVDGATLPIRWVVAHMTGETTRHAGHADILRELLDGVTGR